MKILFIHQYYKTPEDGGAIRSYHMSRFLADKGHEVNVITAYNEPEYRIKEDNGVTVHYLPIYYTNHLSFLSRMHAFVRYVWQATRLMKKIEKPDLNYVISTPLTTGLIALYARWKYKIPYIFEVGDLWPEAPIQLKVLKNGLLKKIAFKLESRVYSKAKELVALSPDIAENIKKKTARKVHVITNLADTEFFTPQPKSQKAQFVIGYIGTVGLANHLEYLLEVAAVCQGNNNIAFVIMGSGAQWNKIKDEAAKRKLDNIEFLPQGNKEEARAVMARVDAIYISFKNVPVLATGSPNKFFDGLAAGKLIITNFEGWIRKLIDEHNCGFYYDPTAPDQFLRQLKPYLNNPERLTVAQTNARRLAEQQFAKNIQLPKLLEVIQY